MKKLLLVALALCLALSMVQVTVADDRLKVNGDFRIVGNYLNEDDGFDGEEGEGDGEDNVSKYISTRFRLGMVFNVAEGITANLRMDFHDGAVWGSDAYKDAGRPADTEDDEGVEMEIDRAFMRIERDMFNFQGGQIFQGFGYFTAYTPQGTGLALRLKLPVTIDLNYFKLNENSSFEDEDDPQKDHDVYAVQASYEADMFNVGGYYATAVDGAEQNYENQTLIGLYGSTKLGPVALKAAVDMFGGKVDSDTDFMGTQMFLNGELAATEALTIGANIYYALAADDDGSEVQIVRLTGPGGPGDARNYIANVPFDGQHFKAMAPGRFSDLINPLNNGFPSPYCVDRTGEDSGVSAFDVYALFGVMENLALAGQIGYFMPQDDDVTDWENSLLVQASALYTFAPRCDLFAGVYQRSESFDGDDPDAELGAIAAVKIHW